MGLLQQGDIVRTVCELVSDTAAPAALPKGVLGLLGRLLGTRFEENETLDVWDFVPTDYPGRWAVTEYQVKLVQRER